MISDLILTGTASPRVEEIPLIPNTWLIHDLLTAEEASSFISKIVFDEEIDTRTRIRETDTYQTSINRISLRYKADVPDLADQIFQRLQGIAPETLTFHEEDDELGPFLIGSWKFHSVNERISFLKYLPGGLFSRHRDGIFIKHSDLRSMITVLVYLNDDYTGGRTCAFDDSGVHSCSITPIIGSAFMMLQRVLHEGDEVLTGVKYAIRFDLMYHREGVAAETQEHNKKAEEYLKMANELERSHQGLEAVKYYRMAFKLNPQLESML